MVTILKQTKFVWRGLDLHLGRRKTPVLTLVADATYSHLYRITIPERLDEHARKPDQGEGCCLRSR